MIATLIGHPDGPGIRDMAVRSLPRTLRVPARSPLEVAAIYAAAPASRELTLVAEYEWGFGEGEWGVYFLREVR